MRIVFDQEDVQQILIAHAQKMGVECNAVKVSANYGDIQSIEVYWNKDADEVTAAT